MVLLVSLFIELASPDCYFNTDLVEAGLDFVDMNIIFEFEPCEKQVCHDIVIIDDLEVENDEEFTINVIRPIGVNKNLKLIYSEKTITIGDVDGRLSYIHSYVHVCIIPVSLIGFSQSSIASLSFLPQNSLLNLRKINLVK